MDTSLLILVFLVLSLIAGVIIRQSLKDTAIPYSVALLILGLLLGIASSSGYLKAYFGEIDLTLQFAAQVDASIILFIFLPALVFESAFALEVHLFRRMFSQIALLAVPGLILSTILTALLCTWLLPWEWSFPIALMFGAIVSATDPVAVVALLKEMCSRARLQTLIEGESLLNDGTAIVLFTLFFTLATSIDSQLSVPHVAVEFVRVVSVGALIGVGLAIASLAFISKVFNDSLIEIALTLVMPYLAFYMAEHVFHASGVVAVVTLALIYAGPGRTRFSPEVIEHMHHFWETLSYLFNTLIFILVGLIVAERFTEAPLDSWGYLFVLFVGILIIRAISVTVLMPILSRVGVGITKEKAIVLTWGGLRGAVSLALALSVATSAELAQSTRDQILFLAAGIVVLTIVINGGTMRSLMAALGLDKLPPAKQKTLAKAEQQVSQSVNSMKQQLKTDPLLQEVNWSYIDSKIEGLKHPNEQQSESTESDINREYQRKLLETERQFYWNQFSKGLISKRATKLLNSAVEQALDGDPQLHPRKLLRKAWIQPTYIEWLIKLPLLSRYGRQQKYLHQVLAYESARGLMLAQNELAQLADRLSLESEQKEQAQSLITSNIEDAKSQTHSMSSAQPGLVEKIETHIALRMLLNKQRHGLEELAHNGVIGEADASKLIDEVELQMHQIEQEKMSS